MQRRRRDRSPWLAAVVVVLLAYVYVRARRGDDRAESTIRGLVEVPVRTLSLAVASLGGRVEEIFRRERLHERMSELEARLAVSQLDAARVHELEAENLRFGRLLGLSSRTVTDMQAARVTLARSGDFLGMVVLDRGFDHGVRENAAVVSMDGLVGRVVEVGRASAVVQLIVSASSGVAVKNVRSGVQGVLFGTGGDRCRLRYVPNLEDVMVGDEIVASGLDQLYPAGTLVGTVTATEAGPDAFRLIEVTPNVSFRRLETVLVGGQREPAVTQALQVSP